MGGTITVRSDRRPDHVRNHPGLTLAGPMEPYLSILARAREYQTSGTGVCGRPDVSDWPWQAFWPVPEVLGTSRYAPRRPCGLLRAADGSRPATPGTTADGPVPP